MRNRRNVPKGHDFLALGSGYSRIQWYSLAVLDEPKEVVVTLAPPNWRRAAAQVLLLTASWFALIALAWLLAPQRLNYAGVIAAGGIVGLAPLYLPLLRLLVLRARLPVLRLDRGSGVVHLRGDSRQIPKSDVIAVCEVIARGKESSDGDMIPEVYELQLLLKRQSATDSWLLTGSWHPSAQKSLAPIAASIADRLAVPHYAINAIEGTLVEQQGTEQTAAT
jgi:hypothetical protein